MTLHLLPAKPTAKEQALIAIAAASRDPIARHRRERAGLDIPDQPAELTDETRSLLIWAHSTEITFTKPPGLFRRLVRAWKDAP